MTKEDCDALLAQFKFYKVPVNERNFIDWFLLTNPKEVEQILYEQGITITNDKVIISTIVNNGVHDIRYLKLKLQLISNYVS